MRGHVPNDEKLDLDHTPGVEFENSDFPLFFFLASGSGSSSISI